MLSFRILSSIVHTVVKVITGFASAHIHTELFGQKEKQYIARLTWNTNSFNGTTHCWITLNYGYMPYNRLAHMFQHLNYTQSKKNQRDKTAQEKDILQATESKKNCAHTHTPTKMRSLTYEKEVIISFLLICLLLLLLLLYVFFFDGCAGLKNFGKKKIPTLYEICKFDGPHFAFSAKAIGNGQSLLLNIPLEALFDIHNENIQPCKPHRSYANNLVCECVRDFFKIQL